MCFSHFQTIFCHFRLFLLKVLGVVWVLTKVLIPWFSRFSLKRIESLWGQIEANYPDICEYLQPIAFQFACIAHLITIRIAVKLNYFKQLKQHSCSTYKPAMDQPKRKSFIPSASTVLSSLLFFLSSKVQQKRRMFWF